MPEGIEMVESTPGFTTKRLPLHVYLKENLRRFLIETSLNGLKYIQDVRRSKWERCYYLTSFSIVFAAGLYMSFYFLQRWQSTPVIIGISPRATSIKDVPFPTITICNMNKVVASKVKNIKPHTPEYAMLQGTCFQNYNFSRFKHLNSTPKGYRLEDFKIKYSQKCSEMIIYCKFGPYEEPCTNLFRDVLLDEGVCCVFNRLHPFFLYKEHHVFITDYTSFNGRSNIPVNWDLETGYEEPLPKSYYPRKAAGSGVSMGLTIVLYADIDEYFCSSTNGDGFKIVLYNPVDSPYIKETGLPIMVGHQTRFRINTKLMESHPSLSRTNPKDRKCYFSTEKQLDYYKYYTRRNCEAECSSKQMLKRCNCIPFHMPKIGINASTCVLEESDCVMKTARLTLDEDVVKCKEECLPGCHDIQYFPDMFVAPLAKKNFNLQDPFFRNISKQTMQTNLAMVNIYYKGNYFRGSMKVPYTGFTEFLSQTGGVMSLMVGFSVISVAEVIYFILLKPFGDIFMKRNPSILESKDVEVTEENSEKDNFHPQKLFKRRKNINNRVMKWDMNELQKYRNEKY